jgi:penicillin-binding protein 2
MRSIYKNTAQLIQYSFICGILLIIFLWCMCFYLQIYQYSAYFLASQNNRFKVQSILPKRGTISDRHGRLLAHNLPSYNVILNRKNLSIKDNMKLLDHLNLTKYEIKRIKSNLKWTANNHSVIVQRNISKSEALEVLITKPNSISIQASPKRHYPYANNTSSILGYLSNNEHSSPYQPLKGQSGIEHYYNSTLQGQRGFLHIETNAKGTHRKTITQIQPTSGNQIILTLDIELQKAAIKAMEPYKGAIVALSPYTGDILAMVSSPTYNANAFIDPNKSILNLLKDPNKPLFNRAIKGQFPLASTIKPFISLYAVEHNIIKPESTIKDPGFVQINSKSRKFKDWKASGHGSVDLYKAIVVSCDTYFYLLALKLGIKGLQNALEPFGFGKITNVDLFGEKPGFIPSKKWKMEKYNQPWYLGDTLISGIGQGAMLTTPLQLASATATLATRGKHYKPRLLKSISTENTQTQHIPIQLLNTIQFKESTWDAVINAMRGVIIDPIGTGHRFGHPSYSVAAKTGTAQVVSQQKLEPNGLNHLKDHSLFIAFAPIDNPKIAIAVILENNNKAPTVARKILDHFFNTHPSNKTQQHPTSNGDSL